MSAMTREALLAACPRSVQTCQVEGLGTVCMRALNGLEVSSIYAGDPATTTQRLVVATICDDDGNRILQAEDVNAIFDKPIKVTNELTRLALGINGMSAEAAEDSKNG
jgi:hypothetical protein